LASNEYDYLLAFWDLWTKSSMTRSDFLAITTAYADSWVSDCREVPDGIITFDPAERMTNAAGPFGLQADFEDELQEQDIDTSSCGTTLDGLCMGPGDPDCVSGACEEDACPDTDKGQQECIGCCPGHQ